MSTAPEGMGTPALMHVVVCYATADEELMRELWLEQGATLADAVRESGILQTIDVGDCPTGIFGKKKPPDTLLRDGDRVELYRPLVADPKESRRRRAGARPATQA